MQITKPCELVGKEIYDNQGTLMGRVDKCWSSWNDRKPGWFFGIRTYENVRDTYFRGTEKLIPIESSYIKEVKDVIYLDTVVDELSQYWKDVVNINGYSWPIDWLMEQGIYDKKGSRIGSFFGWVKTKKNYQYYGCLIDPYLSEKENYGKQQLLPIKPAYLAYCSDSVRLNVTLDELKQYWKKQKTGATKKKTTKRKTKKKQVTKSKKKGAPKRKTNKKSTTKKKSK